MVGDNDAGTTDLGGVFRIGRGHDAFEAELAVPLPYHLSHIFPVHGLVQHLREITADRERAAAHVDVLVELREPEPLVRGVIDCPHGLYRELQHPRERQPEGYGKAGTQIAFAVAACDAVYGQHHDFDACVLGPLQHGPVEASILMKIKLIDLRGIVRLAQLLNAYRAERRHAEHRAVSRSRSCGGTFTLVVEETLQGGRRAIDRQSELLAHDGDGEVNVCYAAQDAGHEVTALEALRVTPVGHLVVGGAVDVVEYRTGHPSPGETPEIMKVVTVPQMHACLQPQLL